MGNLEEEATSPSLTHPEVALKNKKIVASLASAAVMALAIVFYLYLLRMGYVQRVFHSVYELGIWGAMIGMIVQILVNMFPVPGEFTAILLLELYGPFLGGVYSWFSGVVGAIGAYYLAKWLFVPFSDRLNHAAFQWAERMVGKRKVVGLLTARFVPFLPYHMVNYASGLLKVDARSYIWTTMIGLIPYHIAVSGMYAGVRKGSLTWGILGIVLFLLLIGLGRTLKQRMRSLS